MECVEALLSGYTQRPPRTQFSYPVTAAAFGGVPGSGAANPLAFLGPASSAAGAQHGWRVVKTVSSYGLPPKARQAKTRQAETRQAFDVCWWLGVL